MATKLTSIWNETTDIIKKEIGIESETCPIQTGSVSDLALFLDNRGYSRLGNVIRRIIAENQPLKAQVVCACILWSLKTKRLCTEAIIDFSMALTSRVLEEKRKHDWIKLWSKLSPPRKVGPTLKHHPSNLYPAIIQIAGDDGIIRIIKEIILYVKNGFEISLKDYVTLLVKRYRRFNCRLTHTDVKIIQALIRNSSKQISEIAAETGYTPFWIAQRIQKLKDNRVLREFDHVPFSKIGIRMFNVLLKGKYSDRDALHVITESPFLYGYRKILAGDWDILAIFCIPDSWQVDRWLHSFEYLASQWKVSVTISEIRRSGTSASFEYYIPHKSSWQIPWDAIQTFCEEAVTNENLEIPENPIRLTPYGQGTIHLEEIDMKILAAIKSGMRTLSDIRRRVQAGQNKVSSRLKILRENGFIVKRWDTIHIGLIEGALIETTDDQTGRILMYIGSRLPRVIVSKDYKSRILLMINLPAGGTFGLLQSLGSLRGRFSFAHLGDYIYGDWGFPKYQWNPETQSWSIPDEEIASWLDSLR